jgi:hypothetical protein
VALGREVHDLLVAVHRVAHGVAVADVALDEAEAGVALEIGERREVAGVGQRVEHGDVVVGGVEDMADVVRPDEPGGAGGGARQIAGDFRHGPRGRRGPSDADPAPRPPTGTPDPPRRP